MHLLPSGALVYPIGAGVGVRYWKNDHQASSSLETNPPIIHTPSQGSPQDPSQTRLKTDEIDKLSEAEGHQQKGAKSPGIHSSRGSLRKSVSEVSSLCSSGSGKHSVTTIRLGDDQRPLGEERLRGTPSIIGSGEASIKNDCLGEKSPCSVLDSDYLNQNARNRVCKGKYGVIGVSELERLYRNTPALNLGNFKENSDSIDVEMGSLHSKSSSLQYGSSAAIGSINSIIFGSDQNNDASAAKTCNKKKHSGVRSKEVEEEISLKSSRSGSSSRALSDNSSLKQALVSSNDSVKSSERSLRRHAILSLHTAPISTLAVSGTGGVIVSGEEGHPIGQVSGTGIGQVSGTVIGQVSGTVIGDCVCEGLIGNLCTNINKYTLSWA